MPEAALQYLQDHKVLYLATATSSGKPHVTPMFFVAESGGIYFSASEDSRTAKALKENATAEVAVADETSSPADATAVSIQGSVSELSGDEEERIGKLFQERYPNLGDGALHGHYWRLEPQDVVQISNGGGHEESHESLGQTWGKDHVSL